MNWYGVKNLGNGKITSYVSDDVPAYNALPGGFQLQGPYASQEAAQAALEPVIASADETTRLALVGQAPATATLAQTFQALQLWLKKQKF